MHQAANDIIRDCQPFLSLMRAGCGPLFRGMDRDFKETDFIRGKKIRCDRIPKNMPLILHEEADKWFAQQFGVRYRGAALLCTGNREQASEHGKVGMIFPIEGFRFCWSSLVRDLFEWSKEKCLVEKSASGELVVRCTPDSFARQLDKLGYQDWDLSSAVQSGNEIMLSSRAYHAVLVETEEKVTELLVELGVRKEDNQVFHPDSLGLKSSSPSKE